MKTVLVVALVLLLLLVALPVAMGMGIGGMDPCPACTVPDMTFAVAMCLAILALAGIHTGLSLTGRLPVRPTAIPRLLLAVDLARPPQQA
ncbi:MAG: hypothetical protein M3285_04460 [Actinomycetota bacterium]|nr:hypothetical protein [Actinomycetota bacterium]